MSEFTLRDALAAKSDQLNAMDIVGCEPVIRIRNVTIRRGDQPIAIYFDGDNNKPWKPSKGMGRVLAFAWGEDETKWVGRHAQLYFEPSVRYAGEAVGGIRIRALSDISKSGILLALAISKQKREPYKVAYLEVQQAEYPDDKFQAGLPAMKQMMEEGKMSLHQIIARCQQTGNLSAEQLAALEKAAPVVIDENENHDEEM